MTNRKHDYDDIMARRERGESWRSIGEVHDVSPNTIKANYSKWLLRQKRKGNVEAKSAPPPARSSSRTVVLDTEKRIKTLEDLIEVLEVDTEEWMVSRFKGNSWEQNSVEAGRVTLLQVKAEFVRSFEADRQLARKILDDMLADAAKHMPVYVPVTRPASLAGGDPVMFEVAVFDPHIGMLAWGREVGAPYDLKIAVSDYEAAVSHLLSLGRFYPVERVLFIVGNDLLHVDSVAPGTTRGGATSRGTQQDIDTRLAKMFTAARRAVVAGIDQARTIAPVDVLVVPGNHDAQQMYRLGEVLNAWYRNDADVNVIYGPNKRKYYGYGSNVFMFTHGEEYRRQRDSLPLIFATECPPELWVAATHKEIHTGHNHINMEGRYHPTSEATETRTIRTRSLPGLTPEDAWHYEEGYKHRRTATGLAFRRSGGIAGLHEFNL